MLDGAGLSLALAAGAGIRSGEKGDVGRKCHRASDPGDGDPAFLEGLAEGLEVATGELTDLVEKEDASMRECASFTPEGDS